MYFTSSLTPYHGVFLKCLLWEITSPSIIVHHLIPLQGQQCHLGHVSLACIKPLFTCDVDILPFSFNENPFPSNTGKHLNLQSWKLQPYQSVLKEILRKHVFLVGRKMVHCRIIAVIYATWHCIKKLGTIFFISRLECTFYVGKLYKKQLWRASWFCLCICFPFCAGFPKQNLLG